MSKPLTGGYSSLHTPLFHSSRPLWISWAWTHWRLRNLTHSLDLAEVQALLDICFGFALERKPRQHQAAKSLRLLFVPNVSVWFQDDTTKQEKKSHWKFATVAIYLVLLGRPVNRHLVSPNQCHILGGKSCQFCKHLLKLFLLLNLVGLWDGMRSQDWKPLVNTIISEKILQECVIYCAINSI